MELLPQLVGESREIRAVSERIGQILRRLSGRRTPLPVLIEGDTGTGKGLVARLLHGASPRHDAPFVDVNCAAIPETLLEAEMFGYERGAFTGARDAKPGLLQTAHRGTIFLDEVGLLPAALQAKLLKVLDERVVRRLGSTRSEHIDVWILTATNENLTAAVQGRRFREDLYHRLAVLTVFLPPLRDRGDDVLLLAEHFLSRACVDYGLPPKRLSADARAALLAYHWPGNVRELSNVVERAALLNELPLISSSMLTLTGTPPGEVADRGDRDGPILLDEQITSIERRGVLTALRETNWNVSQAALRLGISRARLRYRIEKLGLGRGKPAARGRSAQQRVAATSATSVPTARVEIPFPGILRWERRHLAFLRADLVVESMSPSPGGAGRWLAICAEKVQAFGGRVQERGPAAIVAAFGIEPVEDAGSRAALAAMSIVKAAERGRSVDPGTPAVSLALHMGQAMVGELDGAPQLDLEAKYSAWKTLDALVGEPATIVVSEAARPFLERRFELSPREGGGGGVGAYRLVRRERTGFGLEGRPLTPFVGRRRELEVLVERLAEAENGHGQVVAIVGEPGGGKSRIIHELTRAEFMRRWRVLSCEGASYGTATPFLPVTDLLRRYFQIEEADTPLRVRDKVIETMRSRHRELEPHLAPLLGLLDMPSEDAQWDCLDPPQRRERTLDAVKRLLVHESQVQPVLLVVEDLHWIDAETRALLDSVVESVPAARLVLLVTYRPEYRHDWGGKTYYIQLQAGPLPRESTEEFLRSLLGEDASLDRLKMLLIERTGGNPFFLEESVKALVETQALVGHTGAYRAAALVEAIEVPASVQAVLAARIDRLPADERQLLQAAAVVGKDVPYAILHAIARREEAALRVGLSHLQATEFLYEARLFPDLEYTFKHALTHEVAYASLLPDDRRALHGRVVETIETLHRSRLVEQQERLAHHALRAEMWDKAFTYFRGAGAKAVARSAYPEALAYFEQALAAGRRLPESRDLLEQAVDFRVDLRRILFVLGQLDQSWRYLNEAEALARKLGDQRRLGWVWSELAHHFWQIGRWREALPFAERAREIGKDLHELPLQVVADFHLGQVYLAAGEYRRAAESFQENVEVLPAALRRESLGMSWFQGPTSWVASWVESCWRCSRAYLAACLAALGRFDEAIGDCEEAVRLSEELDHTFSMIVGYWCLADSHRLRGEFDTAILLLERALTLCIDRNLPVLTPRIRCCLGSAYAHGGRLADALAMLQQTARDIEAGGERFFQSMLVAHLGEAMLLVGRRADAAVLAEQALAFACERAERGQEARCLRLLGDIASSSDPPDAPVAEDRYRGALALADELGMRPLAAHCRQGLGRLYRRAGRPDQAEEHLMAAAAMFRTLGMGAQVMEQDRDIAEGNA